MNRIELEPVERSAMWQSIGRSYGGKLKQMAGQMRRHHNVPLSENWDTHLTFAAYKRTLDCEEPDYAT